jgi:N-formylglutamate amidohydrolase
MRVRTTLSVLGLVGAAGVLVAGALGVGEAPPAQAQAQPAKAPAPAHEPELVRPSDLVTAQRGSIGIILSAPHGGLVRVPGSKDRTRGTSVRDVNTGEIALLVAQRLTARLGAKPYVVVAQFSRKDADANRAPDSGEAFENDAARAQYEAYHAALARCVEECRRTYGKAVLIDLHGQVRAPEALVRGTRNGATVKALVDRAGRGALDGPESLFGRLKAAGYAVLPDLPAPGAAARAGAGDAQAEPPRETFFDGGYITAHYGSDQPGGVDAIQIEIGAQRSNSLLKVSRDIADAVAGFYGRYYAPAAPAPHAEDADEPAPAAPPTGPGAPPR